MCGIAGVLIADGQGALNREDLLSMTRAMVGAIRHRGPDDQGVWADPAGRVAFGHARLSIVDLSSRGHQPMHYGGRFTIAFNGEIYNFRELRRSLGRLGHTFLSDTDTEVLLAAVSEWGVDGALQKLIGMFAFSLWDKKLQVLYLARDRLGEKPMHIGVIQGRLVFGSELRAIEAIPGVQLKECQDALAAYLLHGYVPAPRTPWKGVWKLPPASLLTIPLSGSSRVAEDLTASAILGSKFIRRYWNNSPRGPGVLEAAPRTMESAVEGLRNLLDSSVEMQMQCDVPMGAFLSGGIDSTAVAATMQRKSSKKISTFTVRFEVEGFDEADHAARVARHLQTEHMEIQMTPDSVTRSIPGLAAHLDEPTANASYFPLHLMAAQARKHVKVILTGDGGDEILCGYNRHLLTPLMWRRIRWMPLSVRKSLAALLTRSGPLVGLAGVVKAIGVLRNTQADSGVAVKKLIRLLRSPNIGEAYERLMWCWEDPQCVTKFPYQPSASTGPGSLWDDDFLAQASAFDIAKYLPDDNLARSDRATMSAGLEVRAPLLDYRIVEFSSRLPSALLVRRGVGKWPLREIVYKYVPAALVDRPKMGFTAPISQWLKGPLRPWAEELLTSDALFESDLFDKQRLLKRWREFTRKGAPVAWEMWAVVIYAAWLHGRRARNEA